MTLSDLVEKKSKRERERDYDVINETLVTHRDAFSTFGERVMRAKKFLKKYQSRYLINYAKL